MKIVEKTTPIHERYVGDEIKITTLTTINNKNEVVPCFRTCIYRSEFDDNIQDIKDQIKSIKKQYNITRMIMI